MAESTRSELASKTNESFTGIDETDDYDDDVTELSSTTEIIKIENTTTTSSTTSTTAVPVTTSTTEITTSTTVESTTEAAANENVATTTIAPIPKNDTELVTNSTESNGILNAAIVSELYTYYTMITPIVLRIIFGISVSITKVKDVLKKPVGIAITLFCNFFYMPLVSCSRVFCVKFNLILI